MAEAQDDPDVAPPPNFPPTNVVPRIFSLKPIKPEEIAEDTVLIKNAQVVLEASLTWKAGKSSSGMSTFSMDEWAISSDNRRYTRSWHCVVTRISKEDNLSFTNLWSKIGQNKLWNQKNYLPKTVQKVTRVKYISDDKSIWTMSCPYPPPMSLRVYTVFHGTWLLEHSHKRRGIMVTLPVDLVGDNDLIEIEDRGVRGRYLAIEHLQEMDGDVIEWRRICRLDSGGFIPKYWAQKQIPSNLIKEQVACIKWIKGLKSARVDSSKSTGREGRARSPKVDSAED